MLGTLCAGIWHHHAHLGPQLLHHAPPPAQEQQQFTCTMLHPLHRNSSSSHAPCSTPCTEEKQQQFKNERHGITHCHGLTLLHLQ